MKTVTAWITDGSTISFSDTHKLNTDVIPTLTTLTEEYEGLVDPSVFIGKGHVSWETGGHDAELEWVLIFEKPLVEINISEETNCILQGMIEGKNLSKLLGEEQIDWEPASLKNNVIATQDNNNASITGGIPTCLGALNGKAILATMRLSNFTKENGSILPERVVDSTVLEKFPVIKFLKELKERADDFGMNDCRIVNLGSNGKQSGYVNNRTYKMDAILSVLKHNPLELIKKGFSDHVRHQLIKDLIEEKEGMAKGSETLLQVFDTQNHVVGKAILMAE